MPQLHLTSLEPDFYPAVLFEREYLQSISHSPLRKPFILSLEKGEEDRFTFKTFISTEEAWWDKTLYYLERIVKCLLWMKGGYRLNVHGDVRAFNFLKKTFSHDGARQFDIHFIVESIFERPFEMVWVENPEDILDSRQKATPFGGHRDGARIGFDLGGSDKKICATLDGKILFTKSILWQPILQEELRWHQREVLDILKLAATYLPHVDAIGGSVPGISRHNKVMVSSIFRGVKDRSGVPTFFSDLLSRHFPGVPFAIANDGDVSALAGSLLLKKNKLLAIALGTSEAGGYVREDGAISSWLNEMAFAPIDYSPKAPQDDWSQDLGCGVQYLSQQAVVRLVKKTALEIDDSLPPSEILLAVQEMAERGNLKALEIFENIGVFLGYALLHYRRFYDIENLLLLGRVMVGIGGELIVQKAEEVLKKETILSEHPLSFHRLGREFLLHSQAVAAASIPPLKS